MMAFQGAGAVVGALIVAWLGRFPRAWVRSRSSSRSASARSSSASRSRESRRSATRCCSSRGSAQIVVFSLANSLVQLIVPNEMRGRVMSIYMVAFRGGMPLGSLTAGYARQRFSAPAVLAVNGVLLMAVGAWCSGLPETQDI